MCSAISVRLFFGCCLLALIQCTRTVTLKIPFVEDIFEIVGGTAGNFLMNTAGLAQDPLTRHLCHLRTDELIAYYGYESEMHTVTTEDGYLLTIFRCNLKKFASKKKKRAVIVQHGILSSSDEFCLNDPSQGLAYVLADAGYDVFLTNSRGNTYSRRHICKNPDDSSSGFWRFSWYELAIYDYPAVIDYVLKVTDNSKVYIIGHSQGTTTLMTLLSERPEYNKYVAAASLLTPVGYLNHSDLLSHVVGNAVLNLKLFEDTELLPRKTIVGFPKSLCSFYPMKSICGKFLNLLFGPSDQQRNDTMMPSFLCHFPSGGSTNQLIHYAQELKHGFFGKYMEDNQIPSDFQLSRITTPLSLHYSPTDRFTNVADVERLIPKLNNSLVFVQKVDEFNHIDFVTGIHAAPVVFSKILLFFDEVYSYFGFLKKENTPRLLKVYQMNES